jgi:hypothetical protein
LSSNLPFMARTDSIPGTYVKGENRPQCDIPGDTMKVSSAATVAVPVRQSLPLTTASFGHSPNSYKWQIDTREQSLNYSYLSAESRITRIYLAMLAIVTSANYTQT